MAGRKRPVVAVGSDGKILSYYTSISDAASMNGLYQSSISRALRTGTLHRNIRWVYESEYREKWMDGRTDEYGFCIRRMRSESATTSWERRTAVQRESMRENCRKSRLEYLRTHPPMTEAAWRKRSKPVLCISTGKVYESATSFSRFLGVDHSAVTSAIRKGRKVKGNIVKYISKEDYEKKKGYQDDHRGDTD